MLEKSEGTEKEFASQRSDSSWDVKKDVYLKFFPAPSEMKGIKEHGQRGQTGSRNTDEKATCTYCGNIHVRQYNQREIFICEDCRKQFITERQELYETIIQTQKGLEALLNISISKTLVLKYKEKWYKDIWKQYRYDYNYEQDSFGLKKEWAEVDKTNKEIVFKVYKGLPKTVLMFMAAVYIFDDFIDEKDKGMLDLLIGIWKPLDRAALIKWYGIHYMYLNGYTSFCTWQDRTASQEKSYVGWCQFLGSPMGNSHFTITGLKDKLAKKRKIESASAENSRRA